MEGLQVMLVERYTDAYAGHDLAHRIDHVIAVTDLALAYNRKLGLDLREDMIIVAGMLHDLFNSDRENHHTLGGQYIREQDIDFLNKFTPSERDLMAMAVEQHRASYKGEYSSMYSRVIASADRGAPSFKSTVRRAYGYAKKQAGGDHAVAVQSTVDHLVDKFGANGYCKYPELYARYWGDVLAAYQTQCDEITADVVESFVL